eukprot:CAMPEP_0202689160 /NCGR_PEP_ID=MMETSP1385-20130828/4493_1 /ASSEMBLY_ACC=CAM_ASM_000861 /TAXON_ID=933848 /ORGANISM="Elphidium margaritaceum" /LENGTH=65 /DNA_ID=CAMNT_0049344257 /DNA_START=87 /DNA_END=284 /DNA_ORIENTATION=-
MADMGTKSILFDFNARRAQQTSQHGFLVVGNRKILSCNSKNLKVKGVEEKAKKPAPKPAKKENDK